MAIIFPEGTQDFPARVANWYQTHYTARTSLTGRDTTLMTLNVTPRSTASRLLVFCHVGLNVGGTTCGLRVTVNGNSVTPLVGDASSNRGRYSAVQGNSSGSWVQSMGMTALYHPNTTSNQVIRCNVGSHDGRSFYVNRSGSGGDSINIDEATTACVLTVLDLEE